MTKHIPSFTRADAEEAAAWRAKLDSEDAGEADWLACEAWLAQSPAHRAAFAALDEILVEIDLNAQALSAEPLDDKVVRLPRRAFAKPMVWSVALAAAAALVLFVAPRAFSPAPAHFTYQAPADSDLIARLPDGASVHLNRGAAISVTYGRERHVTLAQGEASFNVTHDAARPFEVAIAGAVIRDIGTEFNIAPSASGAVISVRSGSVEIDTAVQSKTRVAAGFRAHIDAAGQTHVRADNRLDDAFAWQQGQLIYHDAQLTEIVFDLNRYSARPIVLADSGAGSLRFTGVLAIDDAALMLAQLQSFMPIQTKEEDDRIVIRSDS